MNCKQTEKLLPDYLAGSLEVKQLSKLEQHFSACHSCEEELAAFRTVWQTLGTLPDEQPSEALRTRFESMLEAFQVGREQAQTKEGVLDGINSWLSRWWFRQPAFQLGFAVTLLILGLFIGTRFTAVPPGNQDLVQLRQEVLSLSKLVTVSLLQQPSSSERLRGLSFSSRLQEPDKETLSALLSTLNYDPSLNVRLAAVDALSQFYDKQQVSEELIASLSRQTSPLVQIALIHLFVEMEEQKSLQALNFLKQNELFNQTVRRRASWAVEQLN